MGELPAIVAVDDHQLAFGAASPEGAVETV
jgi:hypothetical protein